MQRNRKARSSNLFLVLMIAVALIALPLTSNVSSAAQPRVELGTAASFGILAGSAISNTGPTTVSGSAGGDIGLYPGADPPVVTFPGQEDVTYSGSVHLSDAVAEQAQADLLIAYNDAAGRDSDETISEDLAGRTLIPGVYTSESSIGLSGTLTLDAEGDPLAVFIFQAGSTLTTGSDSEVLLINGAQPCRVFWQVGSSATLGTGSYFVGHILALTSITATTDVEVRGQLLALNGAVTLDNNVIRNDLCQAAGSLRVTKEVEGPVGDMTLPDFEITVTGPFEYSDTQTIAAGDSYTWEGLGEGTFTVSEGALGDDWDVSGTGDYDVELGEMTDVTLTNTYTGANGAVNGALTVTKVVTGDTGDMTLPGFAITVTGPGDYSETRTIAHNASYTWEDLVPGTYRITEDKTGFSSEWTVSGEGDIQVAAGQTATRTITNQYGDVVPSGTDDDDADDDSDMPKTGGNTLGLTYSGIILSGLGYMLRRKRK